MEKETLLLVVLLGVIFNGCREEKEKSTPGEERCGSPCSSNADCEGDCSACDQGLCSEPPACLGDGSCENRCHGCNISRDKCEPIGCEDGAPGGCPSGCFCMGGFCSPPLCRGDGECEEGNVCSEGRCVEKPCCHGLADCEADQYCENCECFDRPSCDTNDDCPACDQCDWTVHDCVPQNGACYSGPDCGEAMTCIHGSCCTPGSCRLLQDCPQGEGCVGGACVRLCGADADCAQPDKCRSGVCRPADFCDWQWDCEEKGFYCSTGEKLCKPGCDEVEDCSTPALSFCNVEQHACEAPKCRTPADCPAGYKCREGRCKAPTCVADDECSPQCCVGGLCQDCGLECYQDSDCFPDCCVGNHCGACQVAGLCDPCQTAFDCDFASGMMCSFTQSKCVAILCSQDPTACGSYPCVNTGVWEECDCSSGPAQ